jgi:type IV secretion system protein VirB9
MKTLHPWMRTHFLCPAIAMGGLVLGCSSHAALGAKAPGSSYLRATPIIEYGPPSVEPQGHEGATRDAAIDSDAEGPAESAPSKDDEAGDAVDGPSRRTTAPAAEKAPRTPSAVIAHANAMASQAPEAEGFLNAVMTYTFLPGALFKVFTAPNNVTDLVLEPGEEIMGDPAAGDTLRWRLGVGTSAVGGLPQKHVFVKPTRAGLATNLTLNTNRRTYFLTLESIEKDCMVAVQWTYPQSDGIALAAAVSTGAPAGKNAAHEGARPSDVTALNFDYSIESTHGKPRWKPQAVFDDGRKTFIRFDPSILHGESPALFVIERGEMQLVNYRVKQNLYVVDRLFQLAELRLGQDDQDVVRLRNRGTTSP